MDFWKSLLRILDTDMETPQPYGWFHLLFFAISLAAIVPLCLRFRNPSHAFVRKFLLIVSIAVLLLEVYKQVNYSFSYDGETIGFDYQWYSFPFQFCSMPMYVGLLAGLTKKGRVHNALCAFLATFSLFGGICVMLYPVQVFISTVGINIQTMICHGSMITVGVYLLASGYVPLKHKTILGAISVFAVAILCAITMNEIAYVSGILETETFNMFFISPHCDPSLPVYSLVQAVVPYPFCLFFYILGFGTAAYLILLIAMGIRKLACKWRKGADTANEAV